jgi:hypothetical protein
MVGSDLIAKSYEKAGITIKSDGSEKYKLYSKMRNIVEIDTSLFDKNNLISAEETKPIESDNSCVEDNSDSE